MPEQPNEAQRLLYGDAVNAYEALVGLLPVPEPDWPHISELADQIRRAADTLTLQQHGTVTRSYDVGGG